MPAIIQADDSEYRLIATISLYPDLYHHAALSGAEFRVETMRAAWHKMTLDVAHNRAVISDDYREAQAKAGIDQIIPLPEFVAEDAARIKRAAFRRDALAHASAVAKAAYDDGDLGAALERGAGMIAPANGTLENITSAGGRTLARYGNREALAALMLKSGLKRWDDSLGGGLELNTSSFLGARPGMGKTAAMCQIADLLTERGFIVAFFSKEMSLEQIHMRMACRRARVSYKSYIEGSTSPTEDAHALDWVVNIATRENLYIDDSRSQDTAGVESECRRVIAQTGRIDLIMADHLRLFDDKAENENKRLGLVSWRFKQMVERRRLNSRALIAVQLNRESTKREDKRPDLPDLRDSGEIEENADNVTMLHRPDYYDVNAESTIEFLNRKGRNTDRNARAVYAWVGRFMSIEEMEQPHNGNGNGKRPEGKYQARRVDIERY